jgi:hypothetical protein
MRKKVKSQALVELAQRRVQDVVPAFMGNRARIRCLVK